MCLWGRKKMPYTSPPERIRRLPKHAQEIWMAAFNAAFEQYDGDEGKANAVAWAAVKTKYRQSGDQWVAKEASNRLAINLDERADILLVPDFVSIVGAVAKQGHGETLDVLFRQKDEDAGLLLQVRKALVGGAADIKPIWNAAGPHGTHLPLYDLVLRATKANRRRILDGAKSPYRFPAEDQAMKEDGNGRLDVAFEAFKASDELQTVWGVVMFADKFDSQGQKFPLEGIREAMHEWTKRMLGRKVKVARDQHGNIVDGEVVESYQTPSEVSYGGNKVPAGAWVVAMKINDKDVWRGIKEGHYTGFSPKIFWQAKDQEVLNA